MQYMRKHLVLTYHPDIYSNETIMKKIMNYFNIIHSHIKPSNKSDYSFNLFIETNGKIIERYNSIDWTQIKEIHNIHYVNHIKINNNIYQYLDLIIDKLNSIIENKTDFQYCLIHGDTHLGNILYNNDDICFIDPRGYFGKNKLFGIKEYDYAKFLFFSQDIVFLII